LLLFGLGIVFYGGVSAMWPDIRLLGVLQRIALCYLFASLLFLNLGLRGMIAAFVGLLAGYWVLMTFVPVPGIGAGSYAEGANLANWIDMHYLPGWKWNETWDPEGLLSTLPAVGSCLLGVFAGILLINPRIEPRHKSAWLMGGGSAMVLAGYLWGLQFPIVKNIWTSSYVLAAGGYSLILLGAMHQLVDVWGITRWSTVFVWIGANAILLYMLNNIVDFPQLATRLVGGDVGAFLDRAATPGAGGFASYLVAIAMVIAVAGYLYRRKIFLRV
jgi:predicted acyltransferase